MLSPPQHCSEDFACQDPLLQNNAFFPRVWSYSGSAPCGRTLMSATPKNRPLQAQGSVNNSGLLFGNHHREAEARGTKAVLVGPGDRSLWNA